MEHVAKIVIAPSWNRKGHFRSLNSFGFIREVFPELFPFARIIPPKEILLLFPLERTCAGFLFLLEGCPQGRQGPVKILKTTVTPRGKKKIRVFKINNQNSNRLLSKMGALLEARIFSQPNTTSPKWQ